MIYDERTCISFFTRPMHTNAYKTNQNKLKYCAADTPCVAYYKGKVVWWLIQAAGFGSYAAHLPC